MMPGACSEPFLDYEEQDEASDSSLLGKVAPSNRYYRVSLAANVLLLLTCSLLALAVVFQSTSKSLQHDVPFGNTIEPYCESRHLVIADNVYQQFSAPANSIIEYEYRRMIGNDTRFTGHPGATWEASMHSLMSGQRNPWLLMMMFCLRGKRLTKL